MSEQTPDSDRLGYEHSLRFRRVANRYARRVTEAYGGDIAAAAAASDAEVAEHVAGWERANGLPVTDWPAVGRAEGHGTPEDAEAQYLFLASRLDADPSGTVQSAE